MATDDDIDDMYPSDYELETITAWDYRDPVGWFAYIKSVGNYWPDEAFWWHQAEDGTLRISTGGWSGNESILDAMRQNQMLWSITWESTRRGGHYEFILSRP